MHNLLKSLFRLVIIILLVVNPLAGNSQVYNNWLFGDGAGISFNAHINPAIPFPVNGNNIRTYEGTSSISDEDGNLLFYTNGVVIYNKDHQVMQGGDNLMGNESAFQAAVAVKMPGSDSLYYVFTADAIENNFKNGHTYSIVDMSKENRRGEVILRNQKLTASGTERLTAARHANGFDVWIITNDKNTNIFRSWLLTCNGLQTTPVTSVSGEVMNSYVSMNMGSMKVSADGKKFVQTHFPEDVPNFFQLFDFNNQTGIISNAKKIADGISQYLAAEFSPNSSLLYVTEPFNRTVLQYEATLTTASAIVGSMVSLPAPPSIYGLQLAPDGKIYVTNFSAFLSVINSPDKKGVDANFILNQVQINNNGRLSLPFVLQELQPDPHYFTFNYANGCNGVVQFNGNTSLPNAQWEWDFGDGTKSAAQNPMHTFSTTDKIYLVKLKIRSPAICGFILRSKPVSPKETFTLAAFDFSVRCDSNIVMFTNKSVAPDDATYVWSFGDGQTSVEKNPVHKYSSSGNYTINLSIVTGATCASNSIQKNISLQFVEANASADQMIMEGQSVQLSATGTGNTFEWSPGTWLNNTKIPNPIATPLDDITYTVTVTNNAGCANTDTVRITVNKLPDFYIPTAFTPNNDGLNDVLKPIVGTRYFLEEFSIYNRWGQKLFTTKEKGKGWNGKWKGVEQSTGIYVWIIQTKLNTGPKIQRQGTVVLIR